MLVNVCGDMLIKHSQDTRTTTTVFTVTTICCALCLVPIPMFSQNSWGYITSCRWWPRYSFMDHGCLLSESACVVQRCSSFIMNSRREETHRSVLVTIVEMQISPHLLFFLVCMCAFCFSFVSVCVHARVCLWRVSLV